MLTEALTIGQQSGERCHEPELHRLKGELLLHAGRRMQNAERRTPSSLQHSAQAEACFQQAIAIARRQQAKSWELRAATSLARLWQRQGKKAEARELLAPVYDWFTEGFDTPDLQEAKSLVEALG